MDIEDVDNSHSLGYSIKKYDEETLSYFLDYILKK